MDDLIYKGILQTIRKLVNIGIQSICQRETMVPDRTRIRWYHVFTELERILNENKINEN